MQRATTPSPATNFLGVVVALVCWFSVFPTAAAQGPSVQGQNAVYNSGTKVPSPDFIDASQFAKTGVDFCKVLNGILSSNSYPSTGAVIDARGLLPGTTGTSMICSISPWGSGSTSINVPSTILLPATGGATPTPIVISNQWILPASTRVIGEGDGIPSSGSMPGTTIQAASGFSGNMVQFGSNCSPPQGGPSLCTGISVENLTLDGQGGAITGIQAESAGVQSYVDHVSLYQIRGTGLSASTGPYSNITFDTGGFSGLTSTVCAQILGGTGIRHLTCISETNDASAAILLDSSNNSLQDVRIVGFYDGISVGANANAQSNVLVNIIGDTNLAGGGTTPIIVVHIHSAGHTVSDLSIVGANNAGGSSGTITIQDDVSGPKLTDTSVGIYALGELAPSGGYSRFTTSPNAATWVSGTTAPSSSCTSNASGSLYSNSSGTGGVLWVCPANLSSATWKKIM